MTSVFIGGRAVGRNERCYVIADAGSHHEGDPQLGYRLIETAGAAGADAIVFDAPGPTGPLSERDFKSLLGHAHHVGLTAFARPHDEGSVNLLVSLDVPAFRIGVGSPEMVRRVAGLGRPVLATLPGGSPAEVAALLTLCKEAGNPCVCILHTGDVSGGGCDALERTILAFPLLPVGVVDLCPGSAGAHAAVLKGACIVERDYALDGGSLLKAAVRAIRESEQGAATKKESPVP